jgi:probable HAF family extracellular repeat protein
MQDLGIASVFPNSQASGINNAGQVVGGLSGSPLENVGKCAFLYSAGQMQALPIGAENQPQNAACAINDAGQIVGQDDAGNAFIYYNGTMQELGNLGGTGSTALGINNSGQVVGSANTVGGNTHAFLYSGGVMQDLGTLGGSDSSALAINNAGLIVGNAVGASLLPHAFLYSGGLMQDLGNLIGHQYLSSAQGINNEGQVVGYWAFDPINPYHAFLYSGGTVTDLNTVIDSSSGWTLQDATGINDQGQIVGYGLNSSGQQDAFLLTPTPEPATVSLLALGGLAIFRRRSGQ